MKIMLRMLALGLLMAPLWASALPIPERAKAQAAVFQAELDLTAEQTAALEAGLVEKLTVGKEAWQLKKDGDEETAKAMNKDAGKKFYQVLKATLSKDQMTIYQDNKDAIMEKVREIQ